MEKFRSLSLVMTSVSLGDKTCGCITYRNLKKKKKNKGRLNIRKKSDSMNVTVFKLDIEICTFYFILLFYTNM